MATAASVDDYPAALPDERRAAMEDLRRTIRAAAPDAVVTEFDDEVAPFLAGRGTIRFPAGAPIPLELVARIVAVRLREHDAH